MPWKLRTSASTVPIVIVNVSEYRCDALIIPKTGDLQVIRLDKLEKHHVDDDLLKLIEMLPLSDRGKFERMLDRLWRTIGEPVLRALEKFGIASRFLDPPHVRWCLTGRLAFLPIHAACPADGKGKEGMLDYVVSSYIPTLSTILRTQASQTKPTNNNNYPRVLAIRHSEDQRAPLPWAKIEIENLRKHAGSHPIYELSENEAVSEAVLREIRTSDWVHFACHGKQDVASPMESALILHDGHMPVSRIAAEVTSTGEFAMLLACETAMGSPALSDEAIHVAAGLHFAGFRGAVATMWSIRDDLGTQVADSVYGIMFGRRRQGEGLGQETSVRPAADTAPYALRETLLKLRDGELTKKRVKAREWAPFIHYGL
ncbi:CHAT domain-containing protein [Hysterangium stoloniferum]|nr:CHAT domain-containing protein [Hysterangium stoloniferum]